MSRTATDLENAIVAILGEQMSFNLKVIKAVLALRGGDKDEVEKTIEELADDLTGMLQTNMKLVSTVHGLSHGD